MRRSVLLAVLVAGCVTEEHVSRQRSTGVVAEVHLHQYEGGSHAAAGFVRNGVPLRPELDEQLVHFATTETAREGGCRLDIPSRCTPTCDGATAFCEGGRCVPYTPLVFEDGGPVVITGSSELSPLRLVFDARIPAYRSARAFNRPLFAGGDALVIDVPSGAWSFRTEVVAPARPEITTTLKLPATGPLAIAWRATSGAIAVRITVATRESATGNITCLQDVDSGSMTVPASLLARLPRAPRSIAWSVERFERRVLTLRPGELAVVTVASTHLVDDTE